MMRPKLAFSLRWAGVALLVMGIATFVVLTLVIMDRPRQFMIAGVGVVAGTGIVLILLSGRRGAAPEPVAHIPEILLGIFFTFGTVGPLIAMILSPTSNENFVVGLVNIFIAGGCGVLWAFSIIKRAYWLIPVAIVVTAFLPRPVFIGLDRLGLLENFGDLSLRARMGILGIEALASLVIGYVLVMRHVARVEREAASAEAQLATAAAIHSQLVPRIERYVPGWSVSGSSLPCTTMGGDLIDLIERADGSDLVIADVTGHGVRAGVVMALVKGIVRAELGRDGSLAEAAGRMNRALADLLDSQTFVTAAIARLPSDSSLPVEIVVAGHPPALVRRRDGRIDPVGASGLPLGVEQSERYETMFVSLEAGDDLVLYTDGLSEAAPLGGNGRQLGIDGIVEFLRGWIGDGPGPLASALLDAADAHSEGAMIDDRSVALARARGPEW